MLVVEDDPLDQFLIRVALEKAGLDEIAIFSSDAESAIKVLDEGYRPDLIITDLRMPGMGGIGLLSMLKNDDRYRSIPAVVFSTSSENEDIVSAYQRFANSYIVKPHSASGYERFAMRLRDYWLEENRLPN